MSFFLVLLNYFVFLYPFYMSFAWTIGGLLFYFRRERTEIPPLKSTPFFSVVIAAYNEEQNIEHTVRNLANLDYPEYEVIVVNDGSTDKTPQILDELAAQYPGWFKVIHLNPNSGKAQALNTGILFSKGELIQVIDADCFLDKNALKIMAWHFTTFPRVGAVTGNPRIINRTSLIGKIQVGEYSSIIGLIKRSQRLLGKVLTVSGVIAAFRKKALYYCGFFDSATVTEDIDVTWKLQKKFWDIRYEPRALCWILTPETLRGLFRQRIRWAQGGFEILKKHFDIWFDWRQRRIWPVYIESVVSILWAFSLGFLIVTWVVTYLLYLYLLYFGGVSPVPPTQPFIPPAWTGSILAFTCLIQFMASLYIDHHYEKITLMKYYFWVIWYPLFYWMISALAIFFAVFNTLRKKRVKVRWESPDRGIHKLK